MRLARHRIVAALRERGQQTRADWVERELPPARRRAAHRRPRSGRTHQDPAALAAAIRRILTEPGLGARLAGRVRPLAADLR
ncbi:hypothetical protein [Micromonospora schwarzwaldensis]|uniref:hypothetical protein n=1 Tax=Micromonospora sp. DSM 45708 TaxID=3111767 RepID=UPI0031E25BB9